MCAPLLTTNNWACREWKEDLNDSHGIAFVYSLLFSLCVRLCTYFAGKCVNIFFLYIYSMWISRYLFISVIKSSINCTVEVTFCGLVYQRNTRRYIDATFYFLLNTLNTSSTLYTRHTLAEHTERDLNLLLYWHIFLVRVQIELQFL